MDQVHFANTHETSAEIVEAIFNLAQNNDDEIERIWQDPTDDEFLAIWERATKNGLIDDNELQWGEQSLHALAND